MFLFISDINTTKFPTLYLRDIQSPQSFYRPHKAPLGTACAGGYVHRGQICEAQLEMSWHVSGWCVRSCICPNEKSESIWRSTYRYVYRCLLMICMCLETYILCLFPNTLSGKKVKGPCPHCHSGIVWPSVDLGFPKFDPWPNGPNFQSKDTLRRHRDPTREIWKE